MSNQLSLELTLAESRVFAATGKLPVRLTNTPPPQTAAPPNKLEQIEEAKMHLLACQELNRREIGFIHAKMNKRSTLPVGWPDFSVFQRGLCWFAEFKTATGKLSEDQKKCIAKLTADGFAVYVPRSFEEFKTFLIAREQLLP